jgi:hypothetical protein
MKPSHGVVGVWAAGNVVLAMAQLPFKPRPLPFFLYLAACALVAGFGLAALLAVRTGHVGVQRRQPRRASAAVVGALGVAVGVAGFAYDWWLSMFGVYLLGLAAWLLRGERLPTEARPWPVAVADAQPAGEPIFVHHGSSVGTAVPIPADHAAHGPPLPTSQPVSEPPPPALRKAVLMILLVAIARAAKKMLWGQRR